MNFLASPELVTAMSYAGSTTFNPMTDSIPTPSGEPFKFNPPTGFDLPLVIEENMAMSHMKQRYENMLNDNGYGYSTLQNAPMYATGLAQGGKSAIPIAPSVPGVIRRARSYSSSAFTGRPYPQKEHTCPIPNCDKSFKRLEHLKRHVRTHTEDKPYVCGVCKKSFSRSDNLAAHRRSHDVDDESNPLVVGTEVVAEGDYTDEEHEDSEEDDASLPEIGSSVRDGTHVIGAKDQMIVIPSAQESFGLMGPPRLPASAMQGGWA